MWIVYHFHVNYLKSFNLINTVISSKAVPDSWKRGEIVPHFEKDSQLEKVNFRPVTVLSVDYE